MGVSRTELIIWIRQINSILTDQDPQTQIIIFKCFNVLNFNAQANNTAQPVITGTKIKNTYVVLPPMSEQAAICVYIGAKLAEFEQIVDVIQSQIQTLTNYRKSLIHECVTGQRRITEADLNRVKAHG